MTSMDGLVLFSIKGTAQDRRGLMLQKFENVFLQIYDWPLQLSHYTLFTLLCCFHFSLTFQGLQISKSAKSIGGTVSPRYYRV